MKKSMIKPVVKLIVVKMDKLKKGSGEVLYKLTKEERIEIIDSHASKMMIRILLDQENPRDVHPEDGSTPD
jgi:hypothetical protein